jgi:hypothetical protein
MSEFISQFVFNTFREFSILVTGPFVVLEMLWVIVPILFMIFLLTFYLTEHENEKNGWRDALTNSVALCFVSIDLLRTLYNQTSPASIENLFKEPWLLLFIGFILFQGLFFAYSSFRHQLPKLILKFITSPIGVYVQTYVVTVLVYTQTSPTIHTISAILLLYLCVSWILFVFSDYVRKKIMHVEDIQI